MKHQQEINNNNVRRSYRGTTHEILVPLKTLRF